MTKQLSIRLPEPLRAHFQARADMLAMPLARYIVFRLAELYTNETRVESRASALIGSEQPALSVPSNGEEPDLNNVEW